MQSENRFVRIAVKYGITLLIGAAFVLFLLLARGFFEWPELSEQYRILADAFTSSGVILLMVGVLIWISTTGSFDMISFALSKFAKALIPFSKKSGETYYDYVVRKREKRFSGYLCIFVVGAVFSALAAVFTALFYSV